MSDPCDMLPWDSEHFGFPIARVVEPLLTEPRVEAIDHWCRANRVRCLYFSATAEDATTNALAQGNGFRLVDVKVTLHRKLDETFRPRIVASRTRAAGEADLPALEKMAAESHRNTRFYYEGRFPVDRCEELYRVWIRNALRMRQSHVVLAEADGKVAGYSACSHDRSVGSISLFAVANGFRGRGIGVDLANASLGWFVENGVREVGVTTQGWNIAAQRIYQRCGFLTSMVRLYYHKWFD